MLVFALKVLDAQGDCVMCCVFACVCVCCAFVCVCARARARARVSKLPVCCEACL